MEGLIQSLETSSVQRHAKGCIPLSHFPLPPMLPVLSCLNPCSLPFLWQECKCQPVSTVFRVSLLCASSTF